MNALRSGQHVKLIKGYEENLTDGKIYIIEAGPGEEDIANGGYVGCEAFIIRSDVGLPIYCLYPQCFFGVWQIVD